MEAERAKQDANWADNFKPEQRGELCRVGANAARAGICCGVRRHSAQARTLSNATFTHAEPRRSGFGLSGRAVPRGGP